MYFFLIVSTVKSYMSEPDLRLMVKQSDHLPAIAPSAFACHIPGNSDQISPEFSEWLRYSMQLADKSLSCDPFVARDTYREQMKQELEYLESLKWYTAMTTKSEQDADELLIQRAQSACAQVKIENHDFGRAQQDCQYRATFFQQPNNDTHVVPEPDSFDNILDLERESDNNTPPVQLYSDPYMGEYEVDKREGDSEQENYSDPDEFGVEYDTPFSKRGFPMINNNGRCHNEEFKVMKQRTEFAKESRKGSKTTFKSGRPRLCQFLIELLNDPDKYNYMIEWLDKEKGVFKFLNSGEVARMWGTRRNKPHMKYENFARSLRTYIAKGILTKPRSKLVYRFASKKH